MTDITAPQRISRMKSNAFDHAERFFWFLHFIKILRWDFPSADQVDPESRFAKLGGPGPEFVPPGVREDISERHPVSVIPECLDDRLRMGHGLVPSIDVPRPEGSFPGRREE